ncbi:MAG: Tn3 family transposase [Acidimicrobiia bacterium]
MASASLVARALVELGRVITTLHILTYCDDPIYRRDIQRILNRGESGNGLARDVAGSLPAANMPQTLVGGRLCDWQQPRW